MSFKDRKRDDHGHVIGNNETDGQPCQHGTGSSKPKIDYDEIEKRKNAPENQKEELGLYLNKQMNEKDANKLRKVISDAFDDDYEEEFAENNDYMFEELKTKKAAIETDGDQTDFDIRLEEALEDGKITQEQYNELNGYGKEFVDAVKNADDDVLDKQFGKDTPERKLVGAMKGPQNAPSGGGEGPNDNEFLKDIGSEVKGSQFGRPETLDEYFERVKDIHANDDEEEFNDWTYFVSQAFGIGKKNAKRYLELKTKSLPKLSENSDVSQGLDKLGITQGFGKRVSKNQFEENVKLSDEDKQKLRKQGFLQNYHGYDIEQVDGKDEYRIWKLGK